MNSLRTEKSHPYKSKIKTMLIILFDIDGIIHCELVLGGHTINILYKVVLKRLLVCIRCVQSSWKRLNSGNCCTTMLCCVSDTLWDPSELIFNSAWCNCFLYSFGLFLWVSWKVCVLRTCWQSMNIRTNLKQDFLSRSFMNSVKSVTQFL